MPDFPNLAYLTNKNYTMKLIITISFLLVSVLYAQGEKKYISTFGQKVEIIDEVDKSNNHTLYVITNEKQKNLLLSSIHPYTKKDKNRANLLFNFFAMQLNNIRYEEQMCYVLVSALTSDIEINQPYYFEGSKDLIFEIEKGDIQKQQYIYIRVYKVGNDEDIYDKYILEDGKKTKLNAVKL